MNAKCRYYYKGASTGRTAERIHPWGVSTKVKELGVVTDV